MKRRVRRKKLTPIQVLERELNDLWKRGVCERDGWRCQLCGATEGLTAHHVIYRSQCRFLRWDLANGICLCALRCHGKAHGRVKGALRGMGSASVVMLEIARAIGQERMKYLLANCRTIARFRKDDLLEIREKLRKEVAA